MANNINVATGSAGSDGGTAVQLSNNIMEIYSREVILAAEPVLMFTSVVTRKMNFALILDLL